MCADYAELKRGGFIPQRQKNMFSLRLRVTGGRLTTEQLAVVTAAAAQYGLGYVHLTSRQGLEIPFVHLDNVDRIRDVLAGGGVAPASLRPGPRTVTACQGSAVCPGGLIDAQGLAKMIDDAFLGRPLPHKFKIGLTGCRNNCLKAEENDIGLKGAMIPEQPRPDNCLGCAACAEACPGRAISMNGDLPFFQSEKCLYCGRCRSMCPAGVWQGQTACLIYFGGLFGNQIQAGRAVLGATPADEPGKILEILGRAMDFYQEHGHPKERFGLTINRVGWSEFETFMRA
jgi:dissimilatory sulfite reductase (desulfoviridin) alpha/beta subunit